MSTWCSRQDYDNTVAGKWIRKCLWFHVWMKRRSKGKMNDNCVTVIIKMWWRQNVATEGNMHFLCVQIMVANDFPAHEVVNCCHSKLSGMFEMFSSVHQVWLFHCISKRVTSFSLTSGMLQEVSDKRNNLMMDLLDSRVRNKITAVTTEFGEYVGVGQYWRQSRNTWVSTRSFKYKWSRWIFCTWNGSKYD